MKKSSTSVFSHPWSLRPLAVLALTLLCSLTAMALPVGSAPEAGKTYYLYHVGQDKYAASTDGRLTLADQATMTVTLLSTRSDGSKAADDGYFFLQTETGEIGADYMRQPRTDGSGRHNQWQLHKVSGTDGVYTISCQGGREANGELFLYYGPLSGRLMLASFLPGLNMRDAEWMLVAESDVEKTIVQLKETADSYDVPNFSGQSATVHLYRTLTADAWNSFCVPFAISSTDLKSQFGEDVKLAEYVSYEDNTVKFRTTTSVTAGTPYLIHIPEQSETKEYFTFENVSTFVAAPTDITWNGITFHGSFCTTTAPASSYVLRNDKVYHLQTDMAMKGFRAYLAQQTSEQRQVATWSLDGDATAIRIVEGDMPDADVYNVAGQRLSISANDTDRLPQGVYIVGGKKITR